MPAATWVPIKKIAAALASAGVIYVLDRLGIDFDRAEVQTAVQGFVPVLIGYLVPDSQVVGTE